MPKINATWPQVLAITLSAISSQASHAQLAQSPLLNRVSAVPPNLMLMLDDSGSMVTSYLYDYGTPTASGPVGPFIRRPLSFYASRSPDLNRLTYDPRRNYASRVDYEGNQLSLPSSLSQTTNRVLFWRNAGSVYQSSQGEFANDDETPYFTPSYVPRASEVVTGSTAVYPNEYDFTTLPPSTLFPKFNSRTDCLGASSCTLNEERANFARWQAWHSVRYTMVATALGQAFTDVAADSVRLGYSTLNGVTSSTSPKLVKGVASLTNGAGGTRKQFYDWLYGVQPSGDTPTLAAMDRIGQYFQRTDSDGPWSSIPNPASTAFSTVATPTGPGASEPTANHASCRRSYALLITDGYWNDPISFQTPRPATAGNQDGSAFSVPNETGPAFSYTPMAPYADLASDTLADLTMYYWGHDLRPDLPNRVPPLSSGVAVNPSTWQNLSFYAVTLGLLGTLPRTPATYSGLVSGDIKWPNPKANDPTAIDDMWHATINGRGELVNVHNAEDLTNAMKRMMATISGGPQTLSGVAVSSTYLKSGTTKYKPEYVPGLWTGNLSAIELDDRTGNDKVPASVRWRVESGVDASGDPISAIPAPGSRNIATWNGTTGVPFTALSSGLPAEMVAYLLGDSSLELRRPGGKYRNRTAVLGDIVNSNPVLVKDGLDMGYETLSPRMGDYRAFVASKQARTQGLLFVGANDGMLHAFRDTNGSEAFAYVPKAVIPSLPALADTPLTHRYWVDGPNVEVDAFFANAWHDLLVSTAGAGAKAVMAIDVTSTPEISPANVLWEINPSTSGFSHLGNVLSDVQAGVLQNGKWVAIFGNGFASAGGSASLFIVDVQTGNLLKELDTGVSGGNGLGGVRVVRDASKRVVGAYAGDLKGNLWKFDLTGDPSQWKVGLRGNPLYAAAFNQPITATPAVLPHPKMGYVVTFGTGKFMDLTDIEAPYAAQRLYGVWDSEVFGTPATAGVVSGLSQLVKQSITNITVGTPPVTYFQVSTNSVSWGNGNDGVRGWYLDLPNQGQRLVYPVERLPGTFVMATTLSPVSANNTDICSPVGAGSGWVYVLDGVTGSGVTKPALDTNGDGLINSFDLIASGWVDPVDGRPSSIEIPSSKSVSKLCVETAQASCTRVDLACGQVGTAACPVPLPTGVKSRQWRQLFLR